MDFDVAVKLGGLTIAFLSGLFMTSFQRWKSKGVQGELIEKLDSALNSGSPHSVAHFFYLLHGLRVACSDIRTLTSRNDSAIVIDVLKRNRRLTISDGKFSFEESRKTREVFNIISRIYMAFLGSWICITVPLTLIAENGIQSVVLTTSLFIVTVALVTQYREHVSAQSAERLVSESDA